MSYDKGFGLREKQHDGTEFAVGAVTQFPPLSTLPKEYRLDISLDWIRTQLVDTCASEAMSNLLSHVNKEKVEALLTWVISRANGGYSVADWGVDLKSIIMGAVRVGAPHFNDSQFHTNDDRALFADVSNWDLINQQKKAIIYKAGTAVEVKPMYGADYFDSVKMVLHRLQTPVMIGVRWNWDSMNPNIDTPQTEGFGHAMLVTGYTVDRLIVLNSWGTGVGDKGYFYFNRAVINNDVNIFGAWTLIDETPEKIKWMIENGIFMEDRNWLVNIIKALIVAIKGRLKIAQDARKVEGVPPYPLKIVKMCSAIERHEGYYVGSRSYRNCNSGNFKFCGQYKAIGKDAQGFAIFPSYEVGWQHLLKVVHNACTGKSLVYPKTMTLLEYFAKYAPAQDSNDPKRYAEVVAESIGCSPFTRLEELV
jgi:hypothetical protein